MIKHIITLTILVHLAYGQELEDYETEVVSEWSSGQYLNNLDQQCLEDCNRTCTMKCPEANLCNSDEIECGKEKLPPGVWPDCIADDTCVPDNCECK